MGGVDVNNNGVGANAGPLRIGNSQNKGLITKQRYGCGTLAIWTYYFISRFPSIGVAVATSRAAQIGCETFIRKVLVWARVSHRLCVDGHGLGDVIGTKAASCLNPQWNQRVVLIPPMIPML